MNKLLKCPKKIVVKYHYDTEDEECSGDFCHAEIYFDGKEVLALTDDYYDKTSAQFEGFFEACKLIWGDKFPEVKEVSKNDAKI